MLKQNNYFTKALNCLYADKVDWPNMPGFHAIQNQTISVQLINLFSIKTKNHSKLNNKQISKIADIYRAFQGTLKTISNQASLIKG